jgi:serine protease AprX
MQQITARKFIIPLLAAIVLALPGSVVPVSAAPTTGPDTRLDDQIARQLQITPRSGVIPVIVEGAAAFQDAAQAAESRVRAAGGQVRGRSNALGAAIAELTPDQVRALANDPSVGRIHFDAPVTVASVSSGGPEQTAGATPITFDRTIGAPDAWAAGATGQGVTVAVLDTGVQPNSAAFGARIAARVDVVDPLHPAAGDPAGHGTHVAGIVAAGRDFPSPGVAPAAQLVSVRVLDENGNGRMSTVIRGLEWTIAHKRALHIDVVVLALGATADGSRRDDPLAAMAELAWRSGMVVVTAAGNAGPASRSITSPGDDPLLLTVGAADESATPTVADDSVANWSSHGPTLDGVSKPDVVAPGRKIVSVRVPGSTVDRLLPTHIESSQTTRLSGTSEATAVTAGAAALLSQTRRLSPDQVKAILERSASRLTGSRTEAQGRGEINVARALALPVPANVTQKERPADGLLRLLASLGVLQVNWDQVNWDQVNWDQVNWDQVNWDQVNSDQVNWDQAPLD